MPSGISYLDEAWNIVTGCSKESTGCENCYAARLAVGRLKNHPAYQGLAYRDQHGRPQWTGEVRCHWDKLSEPFHWRKPRRVGVAFMGDLFHEAVPDGFIGDVFTVMAATPEHSYLVLTKRPERMRAVVGGGWLRPFMEAGQYPFLERPYNMVDSVWVLTEQWPLPNVILGITAENQEEADHRTSILFQIPAAKRWLSLEPLLEDLGQVNLEGINWVVVGCESGPNSRPMEIEWVRNIKNCCVAAGVDFYFKQARPLATTNRIIHCPVLDERRWTQRPK